MRTPNAFIHKINSRASVFFFLSLTLILLAGCKKDTAVPEKLYQLAIPEGFPEPDIPNDNELTEARVALGKKLFYDPILSSDYTISCASCHPQANAFSDVAALSEGVGGKLGLRNSPTLTNVAYGSSFFHDGGAPTLSLQAVAPITDSLEMNLPLDQAIERVKQDPVYNQLFKEAYGDEGIYPITRALEAFQFTLISGNSDFDKYYFQGDDNALAASEKRGWVLFKSNELKCRECHSSFNFSSGEFENNGLYDSYGSDPGRSRITSNPDDEGKFKVPTLRNVQLTAPYMHDGSIATLGQVIDHYASSGSSHPNKSELINGFELSPQDKQDLINFLKSLTDWEFVNNPEFRP